MYVWILKESSSCKELGKDPDGNRHLGYRVFFSFEDAKRAMRETLRDHVAREDIFDREGYICSLEMHFDSVSSDIGPDYDNFVRIRDTLAKFCLDPSFPKAPEDIAPAEYEDFMLHLKMTERTLQIEGGVDAGINGMDASLSTNAFFMDSPDRNYHFYLEDGFCYDWPDQDFILLDLQKAEVE